MVELLILATLFGIVIMLVALWPLLRKPAQSDEASMADYDAAVYKSQLEEVKRDQARGEMTAEEAEAARVEIGRRILQSDADYRVDYGIDYRGPTKKVDLSAKARLVIAAVFAMVIMMASMGTYLNSGNPGMPAFPYAAREAARLATLDPGLDAAIANALRQAQENTDSLEAWLQLAQLQMQAGDYSEAVFSYARAVRLDRQAPGVLAAYGEAQAMAANGTIDEALKAVFEEAASLDASDPRPVFYLAQFEYRKGDPRKALDILINLVKNAPIDAGWTSAVHLEIRRMADNAGIDIADELAALDPDTDFANAPETIDSSAMSSRERGAMIRDMVDGLAVRLSENPDDPAGWRRLARAATVMKRENQLLESYANLLRLEGESVTLLLEKANALMTISEGRPTAEILQTMGRILQLDRENAEALWFSAMAALGIGDKAKAEKFFNRALNSIGQDASEYDTLKKQAERLLSE